jgi:hypothetical protein
MKLEDGKFFLIIREKKERWKGKVLTALSTNVSPKIHYMFFPHNEFKNIDSYKYKIRQEFPGKFIMRKG